MTRTIIRTVFAITLVLGTKPVQAAQTAEGCKAAKLKAAAGASVKKLKCYAAATKNAEPVDSACLVDADTKFGVDFTRIESRGACSPSGDDAAYLAKANAFVADVVADNLCPAKINAAGKEGQAALKCYAKAIKKGDAVSQACLTKTEEALTKAFDKADAKGCIPTGGGGATQTDVDELVASFIPPSAIKLFSAGPQGSGNLGNRATTNATCSAAAASQSLNCSSVVSLLSYTADQVSDFPTSYSVPTTVAITAGGQALANNWADFLDGSWSTCLGSSCSPAGPTAANLYPNSTGAWTGTKPDGTKTANNCDDWTNGTNGVTGGNAFPACYGTSDIDFCAAGETLSTPSGGSASCAAPSQHLLCLCF